MTRHGMRTTVPVTLVLVLALAWGLTCAWAPCVASADEDPTWNVDVASVIAQSTQAYDIGNGSVTCDQAGTLYRITGSSSKHTITVRGGTSENPVLVDLAGVTMKFQGEKDGDSTEASPLTIEDGSYAIIYIGKDDAAVVDTLTGGNEHGVGKNTGYAGICVKSNAHVTIAGQGTLNVSGGGVEYGAAAIGGNYDDDVHDLTIDGSMTINASGGYSAPGIGSGRDGELYNLVINGGTIHAAGGKYAPGIGAGDAVGTGSGGTTHDITINGGTITAIGGYKAAGIGGSEGGSTDTVSIRGGVINATGGEEGAGIGGGSGGSVTAIGISGGIITATGGKNAAGIGGGKGANSGVISLEQDSDTFDIAATGGENGAGIGSAGHDSNEIHILLNGGSIHAVGGKSAAGIGAGNADAGKILIQGSGLVSAKGGEQGCGIGAGEDSTVDGITIEGTITQDYGRPLTIHAEALTVVPTDETSLKWGPAFYSNKNAAIGSGRTECGPIVITNAVVNAAANGYGADIGGGNNHGWNPASVASIFISNCAVTSVDFDGNVPNDKVAPSIGSGAGGNVGSIEIYNSDVTGAGIGAASENFDGCNAVDSITIQGCTVSAIRQDVDWDATNSRSQAAGIGSGIKGGIGSIDIEDSTVVAQGVGGGAGIGSGGVSGESHSEGANPGSSDVGTITIRRSNIKATGSAQTVTSDLVSGGPGIGLGFAVGGSGTIHSILIEDCTSVVATGEWGAAGIGTSCGSSFTGGDDGDGNVTITASGVTATGGYGAAGIGAGMHEKAHGGDARIIKITGESNITATGGEGAAGIGGGKDGGVDSVIIALDDTADTSEFVKAVGGLGAAGIGSGSGGHDVGSVTIQSGRVTATGGTDLDNLGTGAGIGGGNEKGALKNLSISGGIINASAGSSDAYDIGCGGTGSALSTDQNGTFTISGGTVLATNVGCAKAMTVMGGSVSANLTNAYDAAHNHVFRTTLTLPIGSNTKADVSSFVDGYGTTDIYSDANRKVYLYRTATDANEASADVKTAYQTTALHYIGQTLADGMGVLKIQEQVSFKNPETDPVVGDTFRLYLDDADFGGWDEWNFAVTGCASVTNNPMSNVRSTGAYASLSADAIGSYTVTATSNPPADVADVYWPVTATYTGTITQQAGTISITEDPSKVYDSQAVDDPSVTTKGDGAVTYTYYQVTPEGETKMASAPVDAGTYRVEATMAATAHYASATDSKTFTIALRPVTLGLSATLDGDAATLTATVANTVEAVGTVHFEITQQGSTTPTTLDVAITKSGESYVAQTKFANVGAGTYTVDASYRASLPANYSCDSTPEATFDKAKETRAIIGDDSFSKTYGDAGFGLGATASESRSDLGDADVFNYEVIGDSFTSYGFAPSISVDSEDGYVTINHAGKATVKITLTDTDGNYNEAVKYVTVTVARAALKVTPYVKDSSGNTITEATYGSLDGLTYGLTFEGLKGTDTPDGFTNGHGSLEAIPLVTNADSGSYVIGIKRVGDGSITINGTTYYDVFVSRDYLINEVTSDFTVNPATLTVSASDVTGTWEGAEPTYAVSLSGLVLGDSMSSVFSAQPTAMLDTQQTGGISYGALEPGTYKSAIKVDSGTQNANSNGEGNYNYIVQTVSGTLTVAKADPSLAIAVDSKTYDGNVVTPVVTTSTNPAFDGTYAVTYYPLDSETALSGAPKDAGQYRAVATVKDDDHFADDSAACLFTISKAAPDPESPTLKTLAYEDDMTLGADQPLPAGSGWTWDNPDTVLSAGTVKASATYTPADTSNYNTVTRILSFEVTQADGSITITGDPSKTYDGNAVNDPEVSTTNKGEVTYAYYSGSDTSAASLGSAPIDAGDYTVVATVASDGNHTEASAQRSFTISKATPTVDTPTLEALIYKDGLILADESLPDGWTWNEPAQAISVGTVSAYATYTPGDTANYNTVTQMLSFDVSEAQGMISITENVSKVFDGTAVSDPTVSTTGDGTVSYAYYSGSAALSSAPVDAGLYTVVATLSDTSNYKGASASATIEIDKRPVDLLISATHSGDSATVTIAGVGLLSADGSVEVNISDASGSVTASKTLAFAETSTGSGVFTASETFDGVPSGSYAVDASYVEGTSGNYICESDAKATFDKSKSSRAIDVATSFSKTYGDASFNLGATTKSPTSSDKYSYTVIQNEPSYGLDPAVSVDDEGNVSVNNSGTSYIAIALVDETDPGTYNPAVAYVKVTVAQASLTVTSHAYLGSEQVSETAYGSLGSLDYSIEYDGLVNGDEPETFTKGSGTLDARALDERSDVAADPYKIPIDQMAPSSSGLAGASDGEPQFVSRNYAITYRLGTLAVTPSVLTLRAGDATGTWGGLEPTYGLSIDGLSSWESEQSAFSELPTVALDTTKTGGKTYGQLDSGTYADVLTVSDVGTLRKNSNGLYNHTVSVASDDAAGTLTIEKAEPITPVVSDVTMREGLTLAGVSLPAGWAWDDPLTPLSVGTMSASATYTPDGDDNYAAATRIISFKVVSADSDADGGVSGSGTSDSGDGSGSASASTVIPSTGDSAIAPITLGIIVSAGVSCLVFGMKRKGRQR